MLRASSSIREIATSSRVVGVSNARNTVDWHFGHFGRAGVESSTNSSPPHVTHTSVVRPPFGSFFGIALALAELVERRQRKLHARSGALDRSESAATVELGRHT